MNTSAVAVFPKKKPKLKCTLNFLLQDKLQFGMSVFFALTLLESSKLVIE